ncbi:MULTISPECIES: helix-turn-helix transcriptional regulator [Methylobacterium]|uniref:helix-turn-helix transcriptional regulator n=1 Tax=Methylobacterium TaxID=407 RepID=UPI0013EB7CB1|nr:helix-turn-helix transcriptional regulator [Methylobacterium sp. DB0501]NGM35244.1 helix-turn-helix transcriptional regulator [Methylobacterium sp. DB0501]
MGEAERVTRASAAIGLAIDHAACDPAAWDGVMAEIGRVLPGIWPVLQIVEAEAATGLPLVHAGWDPADVEAYEAHYGAVNPWISVILGTPAMVPMHSEVRMPASSLRHTEFHAGWLSRLGGMTASSGIKLVDAGGRLAVLNLQHDRARAARDHAWLAALMMRIGPRMRRAIETNRACFPAGAVRVPEETLLARVADPAFVVTRDLRLVEASRAGDALLSEGEVVRVGALDRLEIRQPRLAAAAVREVALACGDGPADHAAARPVATEAGRWGVTAIGLRRDLRGLLGMARLLVPDPLVLLVLRRAAGGSRSARDRSIRDRAIQDRSIIQDRLADLGLSPAERRLAVLMDGSRSLVQAAGALGIRHETARSQLRQVFAKLGVSRQSELAVFILRLADHA